MFRTEGLFKEENTHTISLKLTPLDSTIAAVMEKGRSLPIQEARQKVGYTSKMLKGKKNNKKK